MDNSKTSTKERLENLDFTYELHDFQMKRLERMITSLRDKYGEDVFEVIKNMDLNYKELLKWYMHHTFNIVNALNEKFGDEVLDIIHQTEINDAARVGNEYARKCGQNTLKNIIPMFGEKNLVTEESGEKGLLFRRKGGCPVSRVSREEGLEEVMCKLHCSIDPYSVKGFNENLVCEVRKSHLFGDDFCEWYIYEK